MSCFPLLVSFSLEHFFRLMSEKVTISLAAAQLNRNLALMMALNAGGKTNV